MVDLKTITEASTLTLSGDAIISEPNGRELVRFKPDGKVLFKPEDAEAALKRMLIQHMDKDANLWREKEKTMQLMFTKQLIDVKVTTYLTQEVRP